MTSLSSQENDEIQFSQAMDQYKRDNRRPFPTWSETLEVLSALGYRKVAEPIQAPGSSNALPPKVKSFATTRQEAALQDTWMEGEKSDILR